MTCEIKLRKKHCDQEGVIAVAESFYWKDKGVE